MGRAKPAVKRLGIFFGALLFLMGAAPAVYGILQAGGIALMLYGAALAGVCILWDAFDGGPHRVKRRLWPVNAPHPSYTPVWWRRLRAGLAAVLALGGVLGVAASALMLAAGWFHPPAENATVVVLGCQVVDGQPSRMLRLRLEKALEWLDNHPEARVVCAGGVDAREQISEGQAMKNWLVAQGIAENRIFVEGNSKNTEQNLAFSAQIIQENGLNTEIAVASDGFHQLRAGIYARRYGLSAGALPSTTPWGLLPSYWVREWLGIARALLL